MLLLQEALLYGQQTACAGEEALFGCDRGGGRSVLKQDGQAGDGLMYEEVAGLKVVAKASGMTYYLDGNNGVAAQFKEIIVDTDGCCRQKHFPDGCQLALKFVLWCFITLDWRWVFNIGQGFTIHLAIGIERNAINLD